MIVGHDQVDSSIVNRRTPKGAFITLVVAGALAACGWSSADAVDGPIMRHPRSSGSSDQNDAGIGGVLELDADCLYVALDEVGERYPIVWPEGTRWDADTQTIVTPDGETLSAGDEVYGSGGYLDVDDIDRLAGADAAALARRCVDNTYGEVAVVNNSDSAIGRP
jgi:hypothetical protein